MPRLNPPSRFYLGVDPGQQGGMALLDSKGNIAPADEHGYAFALLKFDKATEHEVAEWVEAVAALDLDVVAALENVHSMPNQGVASSFKFGVSYGFLRGLLTAHRIPFQNPSPQRWQKDMNCRTGGDKAISRAAAQGRWPKQAKIITNATADALLLAGWRRLYGEK